MGLGKKILHGVGKAGKGIWNATTMDNLTPTTGGGLTSAIITKQMNLGGFALYGGLTAGIGLIKEGFEASNRRRMGRVTYADGLTRMTNSYTTGAVKAMKRASQGDYQAFAGMAQNVVKSPGISRLDDFGADPAMISALYHMGGR